MKTVNVSLGAGDIIVSIPFIKELGGTDVYITYNHPNVADWHPINHGGIDALIPFIEKQSLKCKAIPYSDSCLHTFDINMDARVEMGWPVDKHDIYTWNSLFYAVYPDMTKPYLYVEDVPPQSYIAITQTARFGNPSIDYRALNDYSCDKIFIGLQVEYDYTMNLYPGLKHIEYVPTENYYEAAKLIKGSRLYISNQTALAVIAEGIAHNRILCICKEIPSVIPKTPNGRPILTQRFFEKALQEML